MSGLERIIPHWTAGTWDASKLDRSHYHFLITGDGLVVEGDHSPEANLGRLVPGKYAAHALNANTGAIGIGLCGMGQASERPFSTGPWPLKEVQIETLVSLMAVLCQMHNIPVSRKTTLTHAELQPTLGIAQRGKWDISWLPGMLGPGDPIEVGDVIRRRVGAEIGVTQFRPQPVPPTLRKGDRGETVKLMQSGLRVIVDGIFGPKTQQVLRDFQADAGLTADGICGPKTWAALIEKGL